MKESKAGIQRPTIFLVAWRGVKNSRIIKFQCIQNNALRQMINCGLISQVLFTVSMHPTFASPRHE